MPAFLSKISLLAFVWISYAILVFFFVRDLPAVFAFSVFPVGVVAWLFGVLSGTFSVFLVVILNVAILFVRGVTDPQMLLSEIPGALGLFFLAFVIGRLRDLRE